MLGDGALTKSTFDVKANDYHMKIGSSLRGISKPDATVYEAKRSSVRSTADEARSLVCGTKSLLRGHVIFKAHVQLLYFLVHVI